MWHPSVDSLEFAVRTICVEFQAHYYIIEFNMNENHLQVFDVGPRSWKLLAGSESVFSQWYSAKVHAFEAGALHFHAVTIVTRPSVSW